ncbi:hypothetical protein AYO20_07891 [Fonsecaea nubica]|uniref:FAD/NAD(P)-binding domain-containing protein n=1 Tax=Fonsecaea nubica TaxID=856822 RepID=A0A178CUK1_9EURO|nr:hypothetical protein AYO20_07891 [Fonsecaea nubica]OAL32581.1 hypothetical protein AYO20_07891 [Fonsecaea nubica]
MTEVFLPVNFPQEDVKPKSVVATTTTELQRENGHPATSDVDARLQKYATESKKRFRSDGNAQFIDLATSDVYRNFSEDIWAREVTDDPGVNSVTDGSRCEILILGAGYGGLLVAARLIQSGVDVNDIRMVDAAGGYGGVWWYNRYPGLMCDVESHIYLPLLEELDYMPKNKYSYGTELREHARAVAQHFNLLDKTLFQVKVISTAWNEVTKEWTTKLQSTRKGHEGFLNVQSRLTIAAGGNLNWPKIPRIPGLDKFRPKAFHTSRWDWDYTGGSELDPQLVNLKDKRVAIIGTGATAVQAIPHLARWAKHLYVFQRTPSAVDVRGQSETDRAWFEKEVRRKPGWQRERMMNFCAFLANATPRPEVDMVADAWTKFPTYSSLTGGPNVPRTAEDVPSYVARMNEIDVQRQEKIRARVDEIVKDKATAEKLKAWYPGWCKRPCFHDEYLDTFNLPNVTLVDTDGRGVDSFSENGLVFRGEEYQVDLLVFSTGYEVALNTSPASRAHMEIYGRDGLSLNDKWRRGAATLHGVQSHGFPNMFFIGLTQIGLTPNITVIMDYLSEHIASILVDAAAKAKSQLNEAASKTKYPFVVETTAEAEEDWTQQIAAGAYVYATMAQCPPSYFNGEGEALRIAAEGVESQRKLARLGAWARGFDDFVQVLRRWREPHDLKGLTVTAI